MIKKTFLKNHYIINRLHVWEQTQIRRSICFIADKISIAHLKLLEITTMIQFEVTRSKHLIVSWAHVLILFSAIIQNRYANGWKGASSICCEKDA